MADEVALNFRQQDYERILATEGAIRHLARVVQILCIKTGSIETYDAVYALTEPEVRSENVVALRPAVPNSLERIEALTRAILDPLEIDRFLGRARPPKS